MKSILIFCFAFLVIGCTTTAPVQPYRPANFSGNPWQISGTAEPGLVASTITITINGEKVATGILGEFSPRETFTGIYQGNQITAECTYTKTFFGHKVQRVCAVVVGSERAASLTF